MTTDNDAGAFKLNEPLPLPLPINMPSSTTTTTPPPPPLPPLPFPSAFPTISKYLASATSIYKSSRTHPRYHTRIYSLCAIAVGGLFNFLSFVVALFERYENAPLVVAFWVGFVLALSASYQILDLVCSPSRAIETDQQHQQQQQQWGEFFTMHLPAPFVALVDTLGFLGFLALVIANTIVVSHLSEPKQIYIFNSIPWVIICLYHASTAIQAIPSILAQTSGRQRDHCCIDCKRESERRHGKTVSAAGFDAEATTNLLRNVDGSELV